MEISDDNCEPVGFSTDSTPGYDFYKLNVHGAPLDDMYVLDMYVVGTDSEASTTTPWYSYGIPAIVVVVLLAAAATVWACFYRQHSESDKEGSDWVQFLGDEFRRMKETGEIPEDAVERHPRELKREHVQLIKVIGAGAFGEVWKAQLDEGDFRGAFPAAVKLVKSTSGNAEDRIKAEEELLAEAAVMSQVGMHDNIVCLIGIVHVGKPVMLLQTFCEHGSLLDVLKARAAGETCAGSSMPFTVKDRNKFLLETAHGMTHISQHFCHRDLAARNVLLDATMVCKVADFGLSRALGKSKNSNEDDSDYYRSAAGVYPVRSTAVEAMSESIFSTASDVWSWGIFAIEVYQDGVRPYDGHVNKGLQVKIIKGLRPEEPAKCPVEVYNLLRTCWIETPSERPDFYGIAKSMKQLEKATLKVAAFDNSYNDFGFAEDNAAGSKGAAKNAYIGIDESSSKAGNDAYIGIN